MPRITSQVAAPPTAFQSPRTLTEPNVQPSPINRLSDDLLIAIFVEHVNLRKEDPDICGLLECRSHPLITASHISRKWRRLLLASPSLWTDIVIATPLLPCSWNDKATFVTRRMQQLPEIARTWIERSQNCPLFIYLWMDQFTTFPDGKTPNEVQEVAWQCYMSLIDLICDAAGRWRDVELDISLADPKLDEGLALQRLYNLRSDDVPLLERLYAGLKIGRYILHPPPVKGGIQMAASLRSLKIPFTACGWQDYGAKWSGLTELNVEGFHFHRNDGSVENFGPREALALLLACPNLVKCSLTFGPRSNSADEGMGPSGATMPVTMASLEVLALRGLWPWPSFPESLVLPSLRDLQIFSRDMDSATLKSWFGRFGSGIRSMQLKIPLNVSSDEMEYILNQIPNITYLMIHTFPRAIPLARQPCRWMPQPSYLAL